MSMLDMGEVGEEAAAEEVVEQFPSMVTDSCAMR